MVVKSGWQANLETLDQERQGLVMGGTLSRRFSKLPLWLSHPGNIGAFYGLLLSIALLFPYVFTVDSWLSPWIYQSALILAVCSGLGFISRLINLLTKRMPVGTPRHILYPMPFVGLFLLSLQIGFENSGTFDWIPAWLIWALLLIPGPLYVHVTWAPRWRVLCMLADGENPFSNAPLLPNNQSEEFEDPMIIQTSDDDILEVVEELSEE